jgi:hypothetical protein
VLRCMRVSFPIFFHSCIQVDYLCSCCIDIGLSLQKQDTIFLSLKCVSGSRYVGVAPDILGFFEGEADYVLI